MANETVELYYKGKPINPNRDLPTRTYAEAQAEGLTSSDKLWVRTDGQNTPISAEQISYGNSNVDTVLDNLSATDTSVTGLKIQREGKIVCVFFNWASISVGADGKTLNKVIPEGLRPTNTFIVCCKAYGSSGYADAKLTINTDGTMLLNALDGSAISGLNIIYTQISHATYFIA